MGVNAFYSGCCRPPEYWERADLGLIFQLSLETLALWGRADLKVVRRALPPQRALGPNAVCHNRSWLSQLLKWEWEKRLQFRLRQAVQAGCRFSFTHINKCATSANQAQVAAEATALLTDDVSEATNISAETTAGRHPRTSPYECGLHLRDVQLEERQGGT